MMLAVAEGVDHSDPQSHCLFPEKPTSTDDCRNIRQALPHAKVQIGPEGLDLIVMIGSLSELYGSLVK